MTIRSDHRLSRRSAQGFQVWSWQDRLMQAVDVVAAVIVDHGEVLAARRAPGREAGGLWEFPGGKVEPGETPQEALIREIGEELGVAIEVGARLGIDETEVADSTTAADRLIRLTFFEVALPGPRPVASTDHDELVWLPAGRLAELTWAAPDLPMVARLVAAASP